MSNDTNWQWCSEFEDCPELLAGILEFCFLVHHDSRRPPMSVLGVCNTLLRIKNEVGSSGDLPEPEERLVKAAKFLVEQGLELEKINGRYAARRALAVKTALQGVMSTSPIYALLYFVFDPNAKVLMRLQQVLVAVISEREALGTRIKLSDIASYCLGVRYLTKTREGQKWLEAQDHYDLNSIDAIYEAVELAIKSCPQEAGGSEESLADSLTRTLKLLKVLTGRHVIRRDREAGTLSKSVARISQGTHGISGIGQLTGYELLVLGDQHDETEAPHIAALFELPKNVELGELKKLGVELAELRAPFEFIYADCEELPGYAQAFNAKLKAAGAIKAIERQNQFLPLSTQLLTSSDLADVVRVIREAVRVDRLLGHIIQVMLITASDIERARTLEIYEKTPELVLPEGKIGFDLSTGCWVLRGVAPDFKSPLDDLANQNSRAGDHRNHLLPEVRTPIIAGFQSLYEKGNKQPFAGKKQLPKKIAQLLTKHSDRLTPTRLSRYLLLKAAGKYEPTTASYIFSEYLPSSSARMFYMTPRDDYLARCYVELRKELLASLGEGDLPVNQCLPHPAGITFGGRYCPTQNLLADSYSWLTAKTREALKGFEDGEQEPNEVHNMYTAHCVITQGLLTGIRSVLDPFVSVDQIDPGTGIAVFRDKDGADQFHTRIAPVHPLAAEVAEKYRRHRSNILARYLLISPNSARALLTPDEEVPEVFLLSSKEKWTQAGPAAFGTLLGAMWPWPLNSNRKYLRTVLIEKGLAPYLVDILLGHHARGEAFWDGGSTSILNESKQAILTSLDTVVSELNLCAIEGIP